MDFEKKEQLIYVKDLFFTALYQWRYILIFALLFSVVLGSYSFLSQRYADTNAYPEDVRQQVYEEYITNKKLLTESLGRAEKQLATQKEYHERSVLMKMDPYQFYQISIDLTVPLNDEIPLPGEPEPKDNVATVLHAYKFYLSSDPVIAAVAAEANLEAKYLWELLRFTDDKDARNLILTISHATPEGAQMLADLFLAHCQQAQQQIGENTSIIICGSVNARIDQSVISAQSSAKSHLNKADTEFNTQKIALESLKEPTFSSGISLKKIVFLAAAGAVLGAAFVVAAAWFIHIAGGKVYSVRTLRNTTGMKVLGCLSVKEYKNSIDRWFRKLEGRAMDARQLPVIATAVRNCCPGKKLLITGNADSESMERIAQALQELGLQSTVYGSLLASTDALNALPACDAVLLVESCGTSRYADVILAAERASDLSKPLMGCILLEG